MTNNNKHSRQDWLEFALDVLIKKGPEKLKIAPLCELMGVTKGSFYHHFANRAEFIDSLMSHWYQVMTLAFIQQANTKATALDRLMELDKVIASHNLEAEKHIRAWALKDQTIATHLAKMDGKRQAYLAECYLELGLEAEQAQQVALLAYSSFIGLQHIHPTPTVETILAVSALASKAFLPQYNDLNKE